MDVVCTELVPHPDEMELLKLGLRNKKIGTKHSSQGNKDYGFLDMYVMITITRKNMDIFPFRPPRKMLTFSNGIQPPLSNLFGVKLS